MPLVGSESPLISAVAIFNRRTSAVNASFSAVSIQHNQVLIYKALSIQKIRTRETIAEKETPQKKPRSHSFSQLQPNSLG